MRLDNKDGILYSVDFREKYCVMYIIATHMCTKFPKFYNIRFPEHLRKLCEINPIISQVIIEIINTYIWEQ